MEILRIHRRTGEFFLQEKGSPKKATTGATEMNQQSSVMTGCADTSSKKKKQIMAPLSQWTCNGALHHYPEVYGFLDNGAIILQCRFLKLFPVL